MRLPDGNGVEVCREVRSVSLDPVPHSSPRTRRRGHCRTRIRRARPGATVKQIKGNRSSSDAIRRSRGPVESLPIPASPPPGMGAYEARVREDERLARLTDRDAQDPRFIRRGMDENRQIGEAQVHRGKTVQELLSQTLLFRRNSVWNDAPSPTAACSSPLRHGCPAKRLRD